MNEKKLISFIRQKCKKIHDTFYTMLLSRDNRLFKDSIINEYQIFVSNLVQATHQRFGRYVGILSVLSIFGIGSPSLDMI